MGYRWNRGHDDDDRYDGYGGFRAYVSVAERRRRALRHMEARKKQGLPVSPVKVTSKAIATSFWGAAWCRNLGRYSDYATRLPRGRTYVRNGSVVHLEVGPGKVAAIVSGSDLYDVSVTVSAVPAARWKALARDCAGTIASLVELLAGRFGPSVMERVCREGDGLFPSPREIRFTCTCPDWASMCKHVAAVLYAVGARLDTVPETLFRLRKVSEQDLLSGADAGVALRKKGPSRSKVLSPDAVGSVFGIELEATPAPKRARRSSTAAARSRAAERPANDAAPPRRAKRRP